MKRIALALSLLTLAAAPPAMAHHGTAQEFDLQQTVVIKGVISRIDWMNPHIYFMVDVKEAKGAVTQYTIETVPVGFARKAGLTKETMMDGGRQVEVSFAPGRKDPHRGWCRKIKLSDGRTLQLSGG